MICVFAVWGEHATQMGSKFPLFQHQRATTVSPLQSHINYNPVALFI